MPGSLIYGHAEMTVYAQVNETGTGINLKHLQKIHRKPSHS